MYRTAVSDDVKELVEDIIAKNGWEPVFNVKYYPGTEVGDGYASKHVAIDVISENGSVHKLFAKYALNLNIPDMESLNKFYENEAYFYDVVYPRYASFLKEKDIENAFNQVPKCYGTSTKNVVVLENIKNRGYVMFDRTLIMNDKHIALILKNFAKYHAISFAFKDQHKEEYKEMAAKCQGNAMGDMPKDAPMMKMLYGMIGDALSKFDPEKDKRLLDKCNVDELVNTMVDVRKSAGEYSVITKGDCWCNNMMFLYEKDDRENPKEVIQVDWQLVQEASLVYDLSYFFYTTASEETLAKADAYLDIYYNELSEEIKRLGSDPNILYPRSVFDDEWKRFCKFGFAMSFMLLRIMLASKEEVPQVEKIDMEKPDEVEFFKNLNKEDEYGRRIKALTEFMVDRNYL